MWKYRDLEGGPENEEELVKRAEVMYNLSKMKKPKKKEQAEQASLLASGCYVMKLITKEQQNLPDD